MKYLIFLIICFVPGCLSINGYYDSAMTVVNSLEPPSADDFSDTLQELDEAISQATIDCRGADVETHDQYAYIIPMSYIGKARLYAKVNQVSKQEQACWMAIRQANYYLGMHIRKTRTARQMFREYAVFCRREKIRRNAFVILKESYARAGEKDLETLMQIQIRFSTNYLLSPFAHQEEEYIREVENAGWVRKYNTKVENIGHGFTVFFLALGRAAEQASIDMERDELNEQLSNSYDPYERRRIRHRLKYLDYKEIDSERRYQENIAREEHRHKASIHRISRNFQRTMVFALRNNFQLLNHSPELKKLPSYSRLRSQVNRFDNYVQRTGFNAQAAQQFLQIRNTLDELTKEAQHKAMLSRNKRRI